MQLCKVEEDLVVHVRVREAGGGRGEGWRGGEGQGQSDVREATRLDALDRLGLVLDGTLGTLVPNTWKHSPATNNTNL